jgi:hypothetical protein
MPSPQGLPLGMAPNREKNHLNGGDLPCLPMDTANLPAKSGQIKKLSGGWEDHHSAFLPPAE